MDTYMLTYQCWVNSKGQQISYKGTHNNIIFSKLIFETNSPVSLIHPVCCNNVTRRAKDKGNHCIILFLMLIFEINFSGGARGVVVIVVGNGHGDTSSNPGPD